MDLETMREKLRSGEYYHDVAEEFAGDLKLVWQNALRFHAKGSEKHLHADAFRRLVSRVYDTHAKPQLKAVADAARSREIRATLRKQGRDHVFDCVCELWDETGKMAQCTLCQVCPL